MRYDVVTDSEAKGLTIWVARVPGLGDCTADGASSRYDQFTVVEVVTDGGRKVVEPMPEDSRVFSPTAKAPAARLVHRPYLGKNTWHLEPIVAGVSEQPWLMAGGHYATWSDSRISDLVGIYGALSIHDRKEF